MQVGETTTNINKQKIAISMPMKIPHKLYQNYVNSINYALYISINFLIITAVFDNFETEQEIQFHVQIFMKRTHWSLYKIQIGLHDHSRLQFRNVWTMNIIIMLYQFRSYKSIISNYTFTMFSRKYTISLPFRNMVSGASSI